MPRGRPDLLTLSFVLFLILKTRASDRRCSPDIFTRVQMLVTAHQMSVDTRLHTPTTVDYEKCPRSTLRCFANQMEVLCKQMGTLHRLKVKLEKVATLFNKTEEACRQCELFITQNATIFLDSLLSTLQMMNQQFCVE